MLSSAKKPQERKPAAERKTEILETASAIALEAGLERITVRSVAERLNVRPGLISHYYPAVESLVVGAFQHAIAAERDELIPKLGTPLERLARLAHYASSSRALPLSRLWLNARHLCRFMPTLGEAIAKQEHEDRIRLQELITAGITEGTFPITDALAATIQIFMAVDGVGAYANSDQDFTHEAFTHFVENIAEQVCGLTPGTLAAALHADLIVVTGTMRDFDTTNTPSTDTHLAIKHGRITHRGTAAEVAACTGPHTRVLNFGSQSVVFPGLADTHTHPVWGSESTGGSVDLGTVNSLETLHHALAAQLQHVHAGGWVTGFGLNLAIFQGAPSGRILDTWFPGVPISLMAADAHSLIASPAALAQAGITGAETFADRSRVDVDEQGPTGWLIELAAMDLVVLTQPPPSDEEQADYLHETLTAFASAGITEIHALDFHEPSQQLFTRLETRGDLPVRVRCFPLVPADSAREVWESLAQLQHTGGRRWRVDGVKFMIDGTADGGTAWMHAPDSRGENQTSLWTSPERYREAVHFFASRNIPTVTHAIGDEGVRWALDSIATSASPGLHRIEHLEVLSDDLVDRIAENDVTVGMQPTHATRYTSADSSDEWSTRLGPERVAQGWRVRDLLDRGARVLLSSDWPIGEQDPRVALAEAQLGAPLDKPHAPPVPTLQTVTATEAYRAAVLRPGGLREGSPADLTVFASDPVNLPPHAQPNCAVFATFIDGVPVTVDATTPSEEHHDTFTS